ncbi:AAA family ATPase [Microbacterium sp. KSW2-29]|uniref:AAA family ATPase n=1 Tax=Microbacterium phycohabitans TaxID=3075993 RepID=A0ABU3SHP0_9MICO|nr:AAA family ATPase [Microbacterium sp. KSW2-29]MDU0344317.1 AAA family ATPase [Microbacterium sp. KSW2-29]
MSSTYIETGGQVRVYDSAVKAHDSLPLGTYRVRFSSKEGFSLVRTADLAVGAEKVYGQREAKVDKIFRTYARLDRNLGVMLSGNKGQGKSMFLRMVAERAIAQELPVVLVTEDADGIVDFLDTLDECLVIFDEFEKVFASGRGHLAEPNRQNQFLTLFDGMSSVRRIYCVTVNDVQDVSHYIVNRPGRFHYHMRFDYPGPDEVREYLADQAPHAAASEVENAALFSRRVNLTYDHLRAIAFEMNHPEAKFSEIVEDLNIKAIEPSTYRVEAKYLDGTILADESVLNLHERGDVRRTIELRSTQRALFFSFAPRDVVFEDDGSISIPVHTIDAMDEDEEMPDELPARITLTLVGQTSYSFDR